MTTSLRRWSCTSHLYVLKRNDKRCERHRLNQPRQLARRHLLPKVLSVPSSYQVHQNGGRFSRHCRCNVIQCESYLVNQWRCQDLDRCHWCSKPFHFAKRHSFCWTSANRYNRSYNSMQRGDFRYRPSPSQGRSLRLSSCR